VLSHLPPLLRSDLPRGREIASLAAACIRAYNDWMIDDWCAGDAWAGYSL
jgi:hypothetical protein